VTQRKRRREMLALAQRWQSGTDTQEAFARRHGVSRSALQYWLRQSAAQVTPEAVAFAPVQVTTPPRGGGAGEAVEIVLVSGERVVVPPQASADQVRMVLAALRASC
jgi:hypothetical protein